VTEEKSGKGSSLKLTVAINLFQENAASTKTQEAVLKYITEIYFIYCPLISYGVYFVYIVGMEVFIYGSFLIYLADLDRVMMN